MMKITLLLFTMNELEGSRVLFDKIPWSEFEEKIVVDGNSTDGTREFFQSKGIPVITQKKRGYGNAVREAMDTITGDAVILFHPDGNEDPADIVKFRPLFEKGYECIFTSRMIKGAYNEEDSQWIKPRKWANIIFARIASILWRKKGQSRITDPVNGFRGITKAAFRNIEIDVTDCTLDYQMLIRAYKKGLKITEFPTCEGPRIAGETAFKSIPTGIKEIKMLLREILKH